jgi:hypothetical protein
MTWASLTERCLLRLKIINVLMFIISGGQAWISRWHEAMLLPYVL